MTKKILLVCITIAIVSCTNKTAKIKEYRLTLPTYSFSDPEAIPKPDRNYYPYTRFDGYEKQADSLKWTVIEMENRYIKVYILPEIGGKIWGAVEKSTGNEFIYKNSVVKFRNIAMRGPWTSGGIEFNFGTIGHAPTTATPVDYTVKNNSDGSVSCFVGAIDFLTRTNWEIEIKLSPDKATFTTKTIWKNPTVFTQPYYQWSNAAFHAAGNLEMIFPGDYRIGHSGDANSWPIDSEGNNLSLYKNNTVGDASNHIIGTTDGFFSAYWHDLKFGAGNYSFYGDKLGKKIFLWSQARSGGIWEDLLTDSDGQYVELQTGRLFNQADGNSTRTPFKHKGFFPNSTDNFLEYWFPVMDIGGIVKANETGALNVIKNNDDQTICFSPLQSIEDEVEIYFGDESKYSFNIHLKPLEVWKTNIAKNSTDTPLKIIIGNDQKLVYTEEDHFTTRPLNAPDDFDWHSVHGLYTDGMNLIYQGSFAKALACFEACLDKDPLYVPALDQSAELYLRRADLKNALELVRTSLSIDTYNPHANFLFGLISQQMENLADARDGFSVASLSPSYRTSAYIQLAKLFILEKNWINAQLYAERILTEEANNQEALQLLCVISRKNRQNSQAIKFCDKIENISPLNHYARFEKMLVKKDKKSEQEFVSLIRNELPEETFTEMACWYEYIGCYKEAIKLLEVSPKKPLINLRLSYLYHRVNDKEKSDFYFNKMLYDSIDFVFPFRVETEAILKWAVSKTDNWKPTYFLALLEWRLGDRDLAKELFSACGQIPESPYFYLAKTDLFKDEPDYNPESDFIKAYEIGGNDWRTSNSLLNYYLTKGKNVQALDLARESLKKFPENDVIQFNYANCLLSNKLYTETLKELENTVVLPYEGAMYGRIIYRKAAIFETLQFMTEKKFEQALQSVEKARIWPENLGVGRPHEVDERIEDFLKAECLSKLGKPNEANQLYEAIINFTEEVNRRPSSTDLLYVTALKRLQKGEQANNFIREWQQKLSDDTILAWIISNGNDSSAPVNRDRDFELVREISHLIINK